MAGLILPNSHIGCSDATKVIWGIVFSFLYFPIMKFRVSVGFSWGRCKRNDVLGRKLDSESTGGGQLMLEQGGYHPYIQTGRPVALGMEGAITTPHYLATQAGKEILEKGGHAAEAAIAANAVLAVVYPHMAGLGGDLFALVWDRSERCVRSLNSSGVSGEHATRKFYEDRGLVEVPERGPLAANTVPGMVDGWWALHQNYGKLEWMDLFGRAIQYAKHGFPISEKLSRFFHQHKSLLDENHETRRIFLREGEALSTGERLVQTDLASTLETIAQHGRTGFYEGQISRQVVHSLKKHGGLLTAADFGDNAVMWEEPISSLYRGVKVHQVKPNTQGIVTLMMLQLLNRQDLREIGDATPDYYHLMSEAAKLTFRYRDEWVTDQRSHDIPLSEMVSDSHIKELQDQLSWKNIFPMDELEHLPDIKGSRDTTYLSVVDREGNAVSLIQSIFHEFGSGFIPEGCGFLLQNRGSHFSLEESHPNSLEPGKRTFHTLIPAMATVDDEPYMLFGSMGGEGQPQTQCALLTRVIDYGYNIQQAIEAPRWLFGRTWGEESKTLKLEGRISDTIVRALTDRGHIVNRVEDYSEMMGHAQAILIDQDNGVLHAGADPRGDGIALAW